MAGEFARRVKSLALTERNRTLPGTLYPQHVAKLLNRRRPRIRPRAEPHLFKEGNE